MKVVRILVLASAVGMAPVQADTFFGLHAGYDSWQTGTQGGFANSQQLQDFSFRDKNQQGYYLAFEHLVPVLPNLRVQWQNLQSQGHTELNNSFSFGGTTFVAGTALNAELDFRYTDYVLYYELLDNSLLQLDLGLVAKKLSGELGLMAANRQASQSVRQWLPLLYLDTRLGLPGSGLELFANGQASQFSGNHWYDLQAGVGYQLVDSLAMDVRLKLGYRWLDLQLDDIDDLYAGITFSGIFAGIAVHF